MINPTSLKALALEVEIVARAAGIEIMSVYHQADLGVEQKADESPLTEADQRSEQVIQAGLAEFSSDYLVISEERDELPFSERQRHDIAWLVDPLDGTKEFIKRNGEFCVCIALINRGAPILGVIHAPTTGLSYLAWKNGGAYTREREGGDLLPISKREVLSHTEANLRFCVSRSHLNKPTQDYLAQFDHPQSVPMGSALKFCGLATGKIDVYPRFAPTMEWDTAAGQIIVEETGGRVVDARTGKPMTYNREILKNTSFIASMLDDDAPLLID